MKMEDAQALCLICCYSFKRDTQPKTANTGEGIQEAGISFSNHKQFKLFCKELELTLTGVIGNGFGGRRKTSARAGRGGVQDKLVTESLLALLDSPSSKGSLEVCPSCLNLISRAMELRLKAEEVECHVRRLQQEILRELKEVQGHMEGFYGEVKKIEEAVRNSDVSCLEGYISKKGDREDGSRLRKDVELFRNGIFEVARELSMFISSLDRVTMTNSSGMETHPLKREIKSTSRLCTRSTLKMEESITPSTSVCDMDVWVDDTLPVAVKIEDEEEGISFQFEDDLISGDDSLENNNDFMQSEAVESVPIIDYSDLECTPPPPKTRRTIKQEVRETRLTRATLSPAEPQHPIYQSPNSNCNITTFELSKMGPFRKTVISRALKRQSRQEKEELASQNAGKDMDIEVKYDPHRIYCLKYNEEEDKLTIGNIEVVINEKGKTLQCTRCPFTPTPVGRLGKKKRGHDLERYLIKHVLAKHMDVFRCPLCGKKSTCELSYKNHLREHKGADNRLGICDICDKPCRSNYVMKQHKRTHMNEEERAEADAASDVEEEELPLSNKLQPKSHLNKDKTPKTARKNDLEEVDNYEDEDVGQSELDESASDAGSNYSDHAHASSPLKNKIVKEKPNSSPTETAVQKPKSSTRKKKFQRLSKSISKLNIDTASGEFANMEPFKKLMVCRALIRQSRFEKEDEELTAKAAEERDIEVEHNLRRLYFVKYNSEEDKLKIGEVELIINENANTLQCSHCSYSPSPVERSGKKTREHDIERYLVKHVIAKHMTPLGCPLCMESFKIEWQYNAHIRKHKGMDSRKCDICGKPASSQYNIQLHKWTHMNEEDKEEARRNGMEDPRLKNHKYTQDILSDTRYPCPICGKTFKAEAYLRQHERTHDIRDEIICPKCGKKMLRESYDIYHKLFACPGKDAEVRRVKCLQCEMTFKNIVFMKRHVGRSHTNAVKERPCICETCGKGFKTMDCLWAHKQIHNTSMDWKCECGKEFNQRKNLKRHEVNCKRKSRKQAKEKGGEEPTN